jgi:hypothetical protein
LASSENQQVHDLGQPSKLVWRDLVHRLQVIEDVKEMGLQVLVVCRHGSLPL